MTESRATALWRRAGVVAGTEEALSWTQVNR
jgi:hypothetical protein